jgi:hypothetical protein
MSSHDIDGVAAVAVQSARALRELATKCASLETENVSLREKVAGYERGEQVRVLAKEMEDRGLSPELSMDEKIASIAKYPDLGLVRESIKLAGGGRLDMARVADESTSSSRDAASDSFTQFCLTGQPSS